MQVWQIVVCWKSEIFVSKDFAYGFSFKKPDLIRCKVICKMNILLLIRDVCEPVCGSKAQLRRVMGFSQRFVSN